MDWTLDAGRYEGRTPGEWTVGVDGNQHANRVWTEIPTCIGKALRPVVNLCSFSSSPADLDPTAQANARLIADAPLILAEALRLRGEVAAKQARIDELMQEFCPDEMTDEQRAEWARNQRTLIATEERGNG